jgi:hypothetical protein
MNIIPAEKIIKENLGSDPTKDIFPITILKYLLNRDLILSFFEKVGQIEFDKIPSKILLDEKECPACINNKNNGMNLLCRKHTSIQRVLNTDKVCYDIDTQTFLYMNEIFKMVDDKLCIIYCPHPKLIQQNPADPKEKLQLTSHKIKKISTIVTKLPSVVQFSDKVYAQFSSNELLKMWIKCWFNDDFSLITVPDENIQFCLVPNK